MPKKHRHPGYSGSRFEPSDSPDYVVAELRYDSGVAIAAGKRGGFAALAAAEAKASALNDILSGFELKRVASHFDLPETNLASRTRAVKSPTATVESDYALGGFVQIVPKRPGDAKKIAARLARSRSVWQAYVAPRPEPAAMNEGAMIGSRNFEPAQGYLHSAPNGIGAMHVWPKRGGKGRGVRICDIEGNWNFKHEDLPKVPLLGGTLVTSPGWKDHGTAVLGEMVSRPGDVGTVGIAHEASAAVHSFRIGGVDNTAGAILGAAAKLKRGDVILIELHAPGPTGNYVAMQYWDDVFAAIRTAVDRGIVVVEAAGNGGENFDAPIYTGTGLQKDSGAIVVGAGIPPTDFFDAFGFPPTFKPYTWIGVQRSRIWFSNYGKIVNVQGWGWHVTSCGYGDAQGGSGGKENAWYTHRFSGTSSASPIVTGAAAVLQGVSLAKNGGPLPPAQVRDILVKTGTPQVAGPGVPLSQHIGPLPNLAKAVLYV